MHAIRTVIWKNFVCKVVEIVLTADVRKVE